MYEIKKNLIRYSLFLAILLFAIADPAISNAAGRGGGGGGMHGGWGGGFQGGGGMHGGWGGGFQGGDRWDGNRGNDFRYDNDRYYRNRDNFYSYPLYDSYSTPSYYNSSSCYADDEGNVICEDDSQ